MRKWVKWKMMQVGFKLNCDGSSISHPRARVVVIWADFCSNFGFISSTEAEAKALLTPLVKLLIPFVVFDPL